MAGCHSLLTLAIRFLFFSPFSFFSSLSPESVAIIVSRCKKHHASRCLVPSKEDPV
jgi:hypothetical protein